MPEGATVQLLGDKSRHAACQLVQAAPDGWIIHLDKPKRTLRQSSRFWANCSDIAKSGYCWGGTPLDKQSWHDLLLSGWNVVKHRPARLLIGLENELVSLTPHSRTLSESEMGELLDYVSAWAAMHGINLREKQ